MQIKKKIQLQNGEFFLANDKGVLKLCYRELPLMKSKHTEITKQFYHKLYAKNIPKPKDQVCENQGNIAGYFARYDDIYGTPYLKRLFNLDAYDEAKILDQLGDNVISIEIKTS